MAGGVRISTKTDLKSDMVELYDAIEANKSFRALVSLQSAKKNTIVYYNTRGIDCKDLYPLFSETQNLLRKNFLFHPGKREMAKRKLYEYLFQLNKALKSGMGENGGDAHGKDPLVLLRDIADDLMDDYSEFNLGGEMRNRKILDLIRNDLLEIRELEPYVKSKAPEIIEKFNLLVKLANMCLMILPYARDVSITASSSKKFREDFENLFNQFADIFIPAKIPEKQQKKIVDDGKETAMEPEKMPMERKEQKKIKKEKIPEGPAPEKGVEGQDVEDGEEEPLIDLEELERKARERLLGGDMDGEKND